MFIQWHGRKMLKVSVSPNPRKDCIRMSNLSHPADELPKVKATEEPGQEFRKAGMMRDGRQEVSWAGTLLLR